MRLRILLLSAVLLFACCAPSHATITFVNGTSAGSSDGVNVTTSALNLSSCTSCLLVAAGAEISGGTISDSSSNTWTQATSCYDLAGGYITVWYAKNATVSGSQTFSLTGSGGPGLAVAAFSGVDASAPFDQTNCGDSGGISTTSVQTGSITPGTNSQVLVAAWEGEEHTGVININSSFMIPTNGTTGTDGATHLGVGIAYLIQTSAAAANPTWDYGADTSIAVATINSFKASAGAAISAGGRSLRGFGK